MLQFVDRQLTIGDGVGRHGINTTLDVSGCVDFAQDVGTTIDFLIGKFLGKVLNALNVCLGVGTCAHAVET